MTLDEFFVKLSGIGRAWKDNGQKGNIKQDKDWIRTQNREDCPIVAVANEMGGSFKCATRPHTREAADYLGLSYDDASLIMNAADPDLFGPTFMAGDPAIRQRLREACNLVIPEISEAPVEQVNACKLECAV